MRVMSLPLLFAAAFSVAVPLANDAAASGMLDKANRYRLADLDQPAKLVDHLMLYAAALREQPSYEAAWKAAMWSYYVWQKAASKEERESVAKAGVKFAKKATELNPDGAEGWFWYGGNLAIYGLSRGILDSLHLVPDVERSLKRSMELDSRYYEGAAERNLARVYMMLPGRPISIGNDARAKEMLDRSLAAYPDFPLTYIYLADWHWKKNEFEAALAILDRIHRLPMKTEGNAFFLPWAKRVAAKVRPRIENREPRGLLDPMVE